VKRIFIFCLALMLCMTAHAAQFTDAKGRTVTLDAPPERTAALLGSYGEVWLAAGGTLIATTEDAVGTPAAQTQGGIVSLGDHSHVSLELLLSLEPDFVILSADTAAHAELGAALEDAGVTCGYFSMLDWRGYMELLKTFTDITGRDDLYQAQLESVQKPIEARIAQAQQQPGFGQSTALLIRAYVTSVRAKDSESTVAGKILKDMGLVNIADGDGILSENLTMEAIIMADPDYIFAVTMGADEQGAVRALEQTLLSNPAWATLSAVQEGRFFLLERDLFHYRPNARWAESYDAVWEMVYEQKR